MSQTRNGDAMTEGKVSFVEKVSDEDLKNAKSVFPKFASGEFRVNQPDAIRTIVLSRKKYSVLEAPTGMGKSLIGMSAGRLLGKTTYLVHSRVLQVQLANDFEGVPILWGRQNYKCLRNNDEAIFCDACTHRRGSACQFVPQFPYRVARGMAASSNLRTLNYDYFITATQVPTSNFKANDLVVVDEADSLEDVLISHIGIKIPQSLLRRMSLILPNYKTASGTNGVSDWKAWGVKTLNSISIKAKKLEQEIHLFDDLVTLAQANAMRTLSNLKRLMTSLEYFVECVDDKWLYEDKTGDGVYGYIQFRPIWMNQFLAEKYLWNNGSKFALMSATFPPLPVLSKLLGINSSDIEYHRFKSTFPVERRKIVVDPVANLTYKQMDSEIPKLLKRVKEILEEHKNEKGLIHTVSYKLANEIMKLGNDRLILHGASNKIDMVESFKKSDKPLVLVSPSSERGISLDHDWCRFIIFAKAPYDSLNDKLVNSRIYGGNIGQLWYTSKMLMTVVQGCGRGMRSASDYCRSYILDRQISDAINRNITLIPEWFREAMW